MALAVLLSVVGSEAAPDSDENDSKEYWTYTYAKNIGFSGITDVIKVHFKSIFRSVDQNLAKVDHIWQVSDTDPSLIIVNSSRNSFFTSGTPLKLGEGYDLAIKSIDIDGKKAWLELYKNGSLVDNIIIAPQPQVHDTFTYAKSPNNEKDVDIIKVRFRNAFRGADQNMATVDLIWQVSDIAPSGEIYNISKKVILTSGTLLKLKEGYELAIKSIDIDGNKIYIELSKNGTFIGADIIEPTNEEVATYSYAKEVAKANYREIIKVHFKNAFRGPDQNMATMDRIWQASDKDSSQVIINNSEESILTNGMSLTLREGYELAMRSVDIDGNKIYLELSKNGSIIEDTIIITNCSNNDNYTYLKEFDRGEDVELIKIHFKSIFRGPDENVAIIDRIWQASDTNPSIVINDKSSKTIFTSSMPLALKEDYELTIKSIDVDGIKIYMQLFKNGSIVDNKILCAGPFKEEDLLTDRGFYQIRNNNYAEAIELCNKAIDVSLQNAEAWTCKSVAMIGLEKYNEALACATKATEIDAKSTEAWLARGVALLGLGEYQAAIKSCTKVLELNKKESAALGILGYIYYYDLKDYTSAASYFERQTKIDLENLDALEMLGKSYYMQNQYDKAIECSDKMLNLDSSNEGALYLRGESIRKEESKES